MSREHDIKKRICGCEDHETYEDYGMGHCDDYILWTIFCPAHKLEKLNKKIAKAEETFAKAEAVLKELKQKKERLDTI